MLSVLNIIAVVASVASAAASAAAVPAGNSSASAALTSACTTKTQTIPGYSTVTVKSVITQSPQTWTRTIETFGATSTLSSNGTDPTTTTVYTTTYSPAFVATATETRRFCTETITNSLELTSTVFTGTYSLTPLATKCSTAYAVTYLSGTTTRSIVSTSIPAVQFITEYIDSGTTTITAYQSTATTTQTVEYPQYTSGTFTSSYSTSCTTTVYTATASTATTQSAQCAPTNLISDVAGISYGDGSFGSADKQVDASACCQVCLDTDECAGMAFSGGPYSAGYCNLWIADPVCGVAMYITPATESDDGNEYIVAPGCGSIELAK